MSNKRVVKHHNVMDAENAEGGRCDISGFMDSGRAILTARSLIDSHYIQQIS